jgi:hypothetical protein
MPITKTSFDSKRHHIHLEIIIRNNQSKEFSVDGILDTGAPWTEFSDQFLHFTGFLDKVGNNTKLKHGLETQKYGKIILPSVEICGSVIKNYEVYVSKFEESWGIDALIGLDFFRKFLVTIDYENGILVTEPFVNR